METVELRIRKSTEWTFAVLGSIFFFLCFWLIFDGFSDLTVNDFHGMRAEAFVVFFFSLIGVDGFRVLAALGGFCSGAVASGALWRLNDPRPSLSVSPDRFWFHPSILGRNMDWEDVADIMITRGSPTQLSFVFTKRHMSLYSPIPGRKLQIPIRVTGWSYRTAEENVRSFRRWRQAFPKLT